MSFKEMDVKCCLFDMDGLLLDTETSYTIAQQQICSRFNKTFTWELKSKMMGKKALDAARIFIDELQLEPYLTPESFICEREVILDQLFATCSLMPGAEKLLKHLSLSQVPIALATSSHRRHYELKTSHHSSIFSLFDAIVTGDEVVDGKPAPDIFLLALDKLNKAREGQGKPMLSSDCIVFEDAPSGVESALAAGMKVVMVPDNNLSMSLRGKAHEELESLEAFLPSKWGLPAYPEQ